MIWRYKVREDYGEGPSEQAEFDRPDDADEIDFPEGRLGPDPDAVAERVIQHRQEGEGVDEDDCWNVHIWDAAGKRTRHLVACCVSVDYNACLQEESE